MINNVKNIMLTVVVQELPQDWLTSSLVASLNLNVWTQPSSLNTHKWCHLWPSITEKNQDWLKDSSFSSTITNSVMPTQNLTTHSFKKIFSCNKLKKKKKEMMNQCSMMKLSSMPWNTLFHQLPDGDWVIFILISGIDRTVMLLSDQMRIQEVLLFPAMKPLEDNTKEKKLEKIWMIYV